MESGPTQAIRFIVNRTGNPTVVRDENVAISWTVDQVIQEYFASELADGQRIRLIFMGSLLQGRATLSSCLSVAPQRSASTHAEAQGAEQQHDRRTVHVHITQGLRAREGESAGNLDPESDWSSGSSDWSTTVLRVTSLVILAACWYHRAACPAGYTIVSTGILCIFTAIFAFCVRVVAETSVRSLVRRMRLPQLH